MTFVRIVKSCSSIAWPSAISISITIFIWLAAISPSGATQYASADVGDEIVVQGERQGPRFWRVYRKADTDAMAPSENTRKKDAPPELFVLPTVRFTPDEFEFYDDHITRILDESVEILTSPEAGLGGGNRARLIGTAINTLVFNRSRIYMPKGVTLADRVGADLAAEFDRERARQSLLAEKKRAERRAKKKTDDPDDEDVSNDDNDDNDNASSKSADKKNKFSEAALEKAVGDLDESRLHPFFQTQGLFSDSIDAAGLEGFQQTERYLKRLTKKTKSKPRAKMRPIITYDLAYKDLKTGLRSVKNFSDETNQLCIASAVEFSQETVLEQSAIAEAWATGNVQALKALLLDDASGAPREDDTNACFEAVSAEVGELKTFNGQALSDIDTPTLWADELDKLLKESGVRIALVPAGVWLRKDGLREQLIALGYTVDGPP